MSENTNIELITSFMIKEFPMFSLVEEHTHGPYWFVEFLCKDIRITIEGDIGFSVCIYIENTPYELWMYDRSVIDRMATTEENILYQLQIVKNCINDVGYNK